MGTGARGGRVPELNYFPAGKAQLRLGGVRRVVLAIAVDALAYRKRETTRRTLSAGGIQSSLACGVLMGVFYPLVAKAIAATTHSVRKPSRSSLLWVLRCAPRR